MPVWLGSVENPRWRLLFQRVYGISSQIRVKDLPLQAFLFVWSKVNLVESVSSVAIMKLNSFQGHSVKFHLGSIRSVGNASVLFLWCRGRRENICVRFWKRKEQRAYSLQDHCKRTIKSHSSEHTVWFPKVRDALLNWQWRSKWKQWLGLNCNNNWLLFIFQFTTRAFAAYEAYRGINLITDESGSEAFVRLECSWKNPTKILDLPHIASQAKVVKR